MQADSIIANTITDDIRQKGHQSIRYSPDGFSIYISDQGFNPVYLKKFSFLSPTPETILAAECRRIMEEQDLFSFKGETCFISDSISATLVPDRYFDEKTGSRILSQTFTLREHEMVLSRQIKNRPVHLVYSFSDHLFALSNHFSQDIRVLHSTECVISLSDQVSASDHQRGFVLIETQKHTMDILVIRNDDIVLSNRYRISRANDYIYFTLNTYKQLDLDREVTPLFYSGITNDLSDSTRLLRRYIRKVDPVPYFLNGLENGQKLKYVLLSEATRCV